MRRELTANKAQTLLARIRPDGDVAAVRLRIARDHLTDIRALDARLKDIAGQITALVAESGTTLTSLYGIGPLTAGRILAEVGDIARFATGDKFASYNGTPPSTCPPATRSATACRGRGTGGSTTRCT
jgi:transposase